MRWKVQVLLLLSLLLAGCSFRGKLYSSKAPTRWQTRTAASPQHRVQLNHGGSGILKRIIPQGKPREKQLINPNNLRILAGRAKGMKIESPDVYLRPMMAKVRGAVFSTLAHMGIFDTNTTRVLDVFAGSGSVGVEALSRGACHVTFADFSPVCIASAMKNAVHCGFNGMASSACGNAYDVLESPERFNLNQPYQIVSLTPPYKEIDYPTLIDKLCKSPLIEEDSIILLEYPIEMGSLPSTLGDHQMIGLRNRRYGRTVLAMYVNRPTYQYDFRQIEFTSQSIARK